MVLLAKIINPHVVVIVMHTHCYSYGLYVVVVVLVEMVCPHLVVIYPIMIQLLRASSNRMSMNDGNMYALIEY